MANHKIERIASEISRHISDILLTEARDELLKSVTITGCTVTSDLGHATVYFTSFLDKEAVNMEKEMNEASHFIRGKVSERIDLRHTPDIKFVYDNSVEYGNNIERLIGELNK